MRLVKFGKNEPPYNTSTISGFEDENNIMQGFRESTLYNGYIKDGNDVKKWLEFGFKFYFL